MAGSLTGTVVGAMRPLERTRLGTFARGWIGGTIAYACCAVVLPIARGLPLWLCAVPGLAWGGLALVIRDNQPDNQLRWSFVAPLLIGAVLLMFAMKLARWW